MSRTTLAIWAVPAFLFWFILGMYCHSEQKRETERVFRQLEENVYDLAIEADAFLQRHIASLSENIQNCAPVDRSRVLNDACHGFIPGRYQAIVFDGDGTVVFSTLPGFERPLEAFFTEVRRPGYDTPPVASTAMQELEGIMREPLQVSVRLRNYPGRLVNPQPRYDDLRCFWSWSAPSLSPRRSRDLSGTAGGFLFLIDPRAVPASFGLARAAQQMRQQGVPVGFLGEREDGFLTRRDVETMIDSRILKDGRLAVFQKVRDLPILYSHLPAPGFPGNPLMVLGICYVIASVLLLRGIFRQRGATLESGVSFRGKLLLMYALGYGLPIVISCLLFLMTSQEMNDRLGNSLRNQAFERLSQIDLDFRNVPIRRRLLLTDWARAVEDGRLRIASLTANLWDLYEREEADLIYLISSHSEPLLRRDLSHQGYFRAMLKKPLAERLREFESFRDEGYCPADTEIRDLLSGDHKGNRAGEEIAWKLVRQLSYEGMTHFNQMRGFDAPGGSGSVNLLLAGMADAQIAEINKNVRSALGHIWRIDGEYVFPYMIAGASGRVDYFLLVDQTSNSLETSYLRRVLPGGELRDDPFKVFAISQERYYNPTLPDSTCHEVLRSTGRRMAVAQRDFFIRPATIGGKPVEIVSCKGKNILEYHLMAVIPQDLIGTLLRPHLLQIILWLLGALVLGGIHTRFLREHFFLPIRDLTTAMEAISRKEWDHRIEPRSVGEWGELANQLNHAIAHLREMEMASVIQKELLGPGYSRFHDWELCARNQMNQAIGGDYYDFLPLGPGKLAVILGDVSGHGISAALVTAMGKAGFSILCPRFPDKPVEVFSRVSRIFLEILERKKMMTCFMAIIDAERNVMDVANAGQCFPLMLLADGSVAPLELASSPLGIMKKLRALQATLAPAPTAMIFYSDGFPEALDETGEQVGYERFAKIIEATLTSDCPDPLSEITARIRAITGSVPWGDDATAVVMRKRSESPGKEPAPENNSGGRGIRV